MFEKLRITVEKIHAADMSPLASVLGYLEKHPTDLIVLSTEGREGREWKMPFAPRRWRRAPWRSSSCM